MENVKQLQLSSVVFPVHENDDQMLTSEASSSTDNNAGGSDVVNKEQKEEQVDLEDPIMVETDDDDDDDDDDDYDDDDDERNYEEYPGEEGQELDEEGGSDNESCTSCVSPTRFEFFSADGLIRLSEGDKDYKMITEKFFTGLGDFGKLTTVLAVQKNLFLGPSGQARMESFQIFSQAMARKREGRTNVKCGWYGSSKDGISGIISHGFGKCEKQLYGLGIYLTPQESSVERIMSSPIDENGIRHVLLCRVIMGNSEQVRLGSEQFHPSSEQFDSGVDNLLFPKKYIVWSTNMNTHILPEYVISFRTPISLEGFQRSPTPRPAMRPRSAWMPFSTLMAVLSQFLHPARMSFIKKHHAAFRERKISRPQLIHIVRYLAGDNLLVKVIKVFKAKKLQLEALRSGR